MEEKLDKIFDLIVEVLQEPQSKEEADLVLQQIYAFPGIALMKFTEEWSEIDRAKILLSQAGHFAFALQMNRENLLSGVYSSEAANE